MLKRNKDVIVDSLERLSSSSPSIVVLELVRWPSASRNRSHCKSSKVWGFCVEVSLLLLLLLFVVVASPSSNNISGCTSNQWRETSCSGRYDVDACGGIIRCWDDVEGLDCPQEQLLGL